MSIVMSFKMSYNKGTNKETTQTTQTEVIIMEREYKELLIDNILKCTDYYTLEELYSKSIADLEAMEIIYK